MADHDRTACEVCDHVTCPTCHGTGMTTGVDPFDGTGPWMNTCATCHGDGTVKRTEGGAMADAREIIDAAIFEHGDTFWSHEALADEILAALAEGGWTICGEQVGWCWEPDGTPVSRALDDGWCVAHPKIVPVYRGAEEKHL